MFDFNAVRPPMRTDPETIASRSDWPSFAPDSTHARDALNSMGNAVMTTDLHGTITYFNAAAERLTGWTADEAVGCAVTSVMTLISEVTREPIADMAARCLRAGRAIDLEDGVLLCRRDGSEVPIGDSAAPICDRAGATFGVVLVIQDESEKRRVGHRLSYEATHDALTGLLNRREFERRLRCLHTAPADALADATGTHVLLYLDLDRFKRVNDACGHLAGDAVLRDVGALFSPHLRQRDTLARIGGDEFAILLDRCSLDEAMRIAEGIRLAFQRYRFEWESTVFSIGISVGVHRVTAADGSSAAVLRAADAACYTAKAAGGDRVRQSPSYSGEAMSELTAPEPRGAV